MAGYAVIDVETTGFAYKTTDRICEVAVVLLDREGRREDSYSTLVNPQRDLGAQHIHRIDATDARLAPTFERISGDLTALLGGRTLVAHNAPFDMRFLIAEYARTGVTLSITPDDAVCTMSLARQLSVPTKLADACAYYGIPLDGAHAALVDAEATADLLLHYRKHPAVGHQWDRLCCAGEQLYWPTTEPLHTPTVPRGASAPGSGLLEAVVTSYQPLASNANEDAYLQLLERVLLDRKITAKERRDLDALAANLGLSESARAALHRTYLLAVIDSACEDDVLTADERAHIINLASLLDLEDIETEALLAHASTNVSTVSSDLNLAPGALVVLTGFGAADKARLTALAESQGLAVWPGVKKGVAAVIAKEPGSNSGKAKKARQTGVPVVSESVLT
ncbi:exonuclease domain-containing protein [Demequina globuliformis]|uniref:exonuclease domain-containing protein n=1 Tax=Demequina globuliformis TaxID=676202 RepID=UPI000781AB59|nr:exonuclease domain-containing protein [Demequina globuliformis]